MILSPDEYTKHSTYDLLSAAAAGKVPVDHRLLRVVLDRGEAAVPELLRFGLEPEERQGELDGDLLRVFRHLRTSRALPFFAELARRFEFAFPDELTEAFCELGADSIETLLELREETERKEDVNFALAALGVRDARILQALLEELRTDPLEGAFDLGHYGDPAALPALRAASAELPSGRSEFEKAIEEIRRPRPPEVLEPYDIWADYPGQGIPDFGSFAPEELLAFIKSEVPEYRAAAVEHLGYEELAPDWRDRIFDMARHDPDPRARGAAWDALFEFAGEEPFHSAMLARLEDLSAPLEERAGALLGLSIHAAGPAVRMRMAEFVGQPETRAAALRAMWRTHDQAFESHFPGYLDDADPAVQNEAIIGIGTLRIGTAAERLVPFFNVAELREDALFAYAAAFPTAVSHGRMASLLDHIDELAGGLAPDEVSMVRLALNDRLEEHGLSPLPSGDEGFAGAGENGSSQEPPQPYIAPPKVGRNEPCPCGSGKKYKKCCGN